MYLLSDRLPRAGKLDLGLLLPSSILEIFVSRNSYPQTVTVFRNGLLPLNRLSGIWEGAEVTPSWRLMPTSYSGSKLWTNFTPQKKAMLMDSNLFIPCVYYLSVKHRLTSELAFSFPYHCLSGNPESFTRSYIPHKCFLELHWHMEFSSFFLFCAYDPS